MAEGSVKALRQQLAAQYDDYAARFAESYKAGAGQGAEAVTQALHAAGASVSGDQAEAFARYIQRDLARLATEMRRRPEAAQALFERARSGRDALAALVQAFEHGGAPLLDAYPKADWAAPHDAGEVTAAGTLICLKCGYEQQVGETTYLTMCPVCDGTSFRKVY
jgi:rubrerythrin